ncbi:MAG: hypothetical protein IJ717_11655 [Treponema sp.]|nr:hypothetical protein [Treponema sp.]
MASWRNVYCLKSDTGPLDFWNCVRPLFPGSPLPDSVPRNFYFETGCELFSWKCPDADSRFYELLFSRDENGRVSSLRIVFGEECVGGKGGSVHPLYYEETSDGDSLPFCRDFFALLKKFVPKSQISSKIVDDRAEAQKLFLKADSFPLMDCDFINSQRKLDEFLSNSLNKSFPVSVKFSAGKDGRFPFPENWMSALVDDLWFLNANFVKSGGILSAVTKENFLLMDSRLRRSDRASKRNGRTRERFTDRIESFVEKERERVAGLLDWPPPVAVESDGKSAVGVGLLELGFPESGSAPDDAELYGKLAGAIVEAVGSGKSLSERIGVLMPGFDAGKGRAPSAGGMDFNSRSGELDEERRVRLSEANDNLRKEVLSLSSENASLKSEIDTLKSLLKSGAGTDIDSVPKSAYEAALSASDVLSQKNGELSAENRTLRADKQALEKRVTVLESRGGSSSESDVGLPLFVPCSKKELFAEEIRDYLYSCLYQKLEDERTRLPENEETEASRKRDVLEALLAERSFVGGESVTSMKMEKIESILKAAKKPSLDDLASEGFVRIKGTKTHPKMYFYDERYQVTFSLSPSDDKVPMNKMKEIRSRCFLF